MLILTIIDIVVAQAKFRSTLGDFGGRDKFDSCKVKKRVYNNNINKYMIE
jgi:hypothetical protein